MRENKTDTRESIGKERGGPVSETREKKIPLTVSKRGAVQGALGKEEENNTKRS